VSVITSDHLHILIVYLLTVNLWCRTGSGVSYDVVSALDINPVANSIYQQNFPGTRLVCKCLTVSYASWVVYSAVLQWANELGLWAKDFVSPFAGSVEKYQHGHQCQPSVFWNFNFKCSL